MQKFISSQQSQKFSISLTLDCLPQNDIGGPYVSIKTYAKFHWHFSLANYKSNYIDVWSKWTWEAHQTNFAIWISLARIFKVLCDEN